MTKAAVWTKAQSLVLFEKQSPEKIYESILKTVISPLLLNSFHKWYQNKWDSSDIVHVLVLFAIIGLHLKSMKNHENNAIFLFVLDIFADFQF